jgi:transposase
MVGCHCLAQSAHAAAFCAVTLNVTGLSSLVRDHLLQDPLSGHLYLFANQSHTRLKALIWDGSGLWVCAKRLERGRFHWPKATAQARSVSLRPEELSMLLNGLHLSAATRRRNWYRTAVTGG